MGLRRLLLNTVFCILGLVKLNAQDIQTRAIELENGSDSIIIESSIAGYEIVDYLVNVQKCHFMKVEMATDNTGNYFNIMEPEEEYVAIFNGSINENSFEEQLNKSGDYRIRVYMMRSSARRNETANYRLEIKLNPYGQSLTKDAVVSGTEFHATGFISCTIGVIKEECNFGVIRQGNGGGVVRITKPDGRIRNIFFENGEAVGYDKSEADPGEFRVSKQADLYLITIGEEYYQIPEAVIFGG